MSGKVLLIGNRRVAPFSFPTDLRDNAGNMVHADAAFRILRHAVTQTAENPAHPSLRRFIAEECSAVVYIFANAIRLGEDDDARHARTCTLIEATDKPVIAFGLGAQAASVDQVGEPIGVSTLRLLKLLEERSVSIGVRGPFTAEVLARNGIKSARITGCPSLYSNLAPEFPAPTAAADDPRAVGFAGTHFHKPAEAALLAVALKAGCEYVEPGNLNIYTASQAAKLEPDDEAVKLPQFMLNAIRNGLTDRAACLAMLRRRFNLFHDMEAWRKFCAENTRFFFGTRFHCNMAALLSGVPALWVTHDSRTVELCDFMGLPQVSLARAVEIGDARKLADLADYSGFPVRYRELYANFKRFLAENRLAHNLP